MERLCCPFLTFQLDVHSNGDSQLTLRGPVGAKAILLEKFPKTSKYPTRIHRVTCQGIVAS